MATETMNTKEPSTLLPSSEMAKTGTACRQNWRWSLGSADNLIYLLLTCSYVEYLSAGTINVLCVKLSVLPLATHITPLSCSLRHQEKASAAVNQQQTSGGIAPRPSFDTPTGPQYPCGRCGWNHQHQRAANPTEVKHSLVH